MLAEYELNRERDENVYVLSDADGVCPMHFHRKIEVMYVLEGNKKIVAAGKEITLGADNVFFANSYEMHSYADCPDSKQIIIVFPNRMLGAFYDEFGDKLPLGNVIDDTEFCRGILPYFRAFCEEKDSKLIAQGYCDLLLGNVMKKIGVREGTKDRQNFVDSLLAYINENYAEDITLESMAEHFGYSKYYFSRMFNDALGTSLTDYVSAVRLMHALDIMRRTGCTVSEAALESGFSSLPTFYRVLKKNYDYKSVKELL